MQKSSFCKIRRPFCVFVCYQLVRKIKQRWKGSLFLRIPRKFTNTTRKRGQQTKGDEFFPSFLGPTWRQDQKRRRKNSHAAAWLQITEEAVRASSVVRMRSVLPLFLSAAPMLCLKLSHPLRLHQEGGGEQLLVNVFNSRGNDKVSIC